MPGGFCISQTIGSVREATMSQSQVNPQEIAKKRVVYTLDGMEDVKIHRDVEYYAGGTGVLTMDLYYPREAKEGVPLPAVVMVAGYSDAREPNVLGCRFKEMGWALSWAQLIAASGVIAVLYTNREPIADLRRVLDYVRKNVASLGIDESRIGVLAGSGNTPLALSLLEPDASAWLKCVILCYGYMLDLDGATSVAAFAQTYGFVNPLAGKSVEDLSRDVPLFVARAGNDQFGTNESIDRFVTKALACDLPLTVVNCASAPHAFDLFLDTERTRAVIRQILEFVRFNLLA
jgi:hypothetical protein